ncbi:MAG: hypothetical protein Marn2KO_36720 [Marinobacter nauticus]
MSLKPEFIVRLDWSGGVGGTGLSRIAGPPPLGCENTMGGGGMGMDAGGANTGTGAGTLGPNGATRGTGGWPDDVATAGADAGSVTV